MTQAALWAMVLVPAAVGGVLSLTPRAERLAAQVSVVTATTTAALAALVAIGRPSASVPFMAGSDLALGVDTLSAAMAPLVTAARTAQSGSRRCEQSSKRHLG